MKKLLIIFFLTASCSMNNDKLENNFSDINFSDDMTFDEFQKNLRNMPKIVLIQI
jgi:hypothetical protein